MKKLLLRVTGSTPSASSGQAYVAAAILTQADGAWTVERTAPILSWMHGLDMPTIRQRLEADGATWEWLPISQRFVALAVNVTDGEALVFAGMQNAIKAEARKAAIVRNRRRGYHAQNQR